MSLSKDIAVSVKQETQLKSLISEFHMKDELLLIKVELEIKKTSKKAEIAGQKYRKCRIVEVENEKLRLQQGVEKRKICHSMEKHLRDFTMLQGLQEYYETVRSDLKIRIESRVNRFGGWILKGEGGGLHVELNRLRTFDKNKIPYVDAETLSLLGFYYFGPDDMVKCFSCRVVIGCWEEEDDVLASHRELSPNCDFINGRCQINVPINDKRLKDAIRVRRAEEDVVGTTVTEGSITNLTEEDRKMYAESDICGKFDIEKLMKMCGVKTCD